MAKNEDSQQNSELQQDGETNPLNQEVNDPAQQLNADQSQEQDGQDGGEEQQQENRVVDQGEVTDPGNSGLVGEAYNQGSVTGSADKPNG